MSSYSVFFENLSSLGRLSLRFRPAEEVQIDIASKLYENFVAMTASERTKVLTYVSETSLGNKLLTLSGYLAETAINRENVGILKYAVVMHEIEDFHYDFRENIRYLVLIKHSATALHVNIKDVIYSVLDNASARAKRYLEEFAARDSESTKLSSFGIRGEATSGIFRFVPSE